jgi:CubicO group peptidase (beta-lactamase class C family)
MRKSIFGALVAAVVLAGASHAQPGPDPLEGLWRAKRWFGPEARGPLVIRREGESWRADMMGQVLPVRMERGELWFGLPNARGSFRGRLEAGEGIAGVWTPERARANGGYATPVLLEPDGPDRWRGEVVPYDDVFTFYLLVRRRPDGSLGVLLRNPERDYGALLNVSRLVSDSGGVRLIGRPPWERQEGAVARGSYDAEDSVLTLAFWSRGGNYEFRREGDASGFYPRGRNPGRYVYAPPPAARDGWPTGTLESAGIDRGAIERSVQVLLDMPMDTIDAPQVHGLLLARHGTLVLEEYFHGEHRDRLHETRSASKSLTATLIGAAMQAGAPLTLATRVYEIMNGGGMPAELDPRKRAMTLEHLMTMTSGFFCDDNNPDAPGNEEVMGNQTQEPDYYRYTMNVPMAFAPGDTAIYCSASPNLALGVLRRATGEFPPYTFQRLLGRPLQISHYAWPLDPAGQAFGGGSVQMRPRDFMKLGQLMLNGGTWKGHRLLGRAFVERASSPLYRIGSRRYGLLWWCFDYPRDGDTLHVYSALGAGGQIVMVVPAIDLVLAIYGGSYSSRGWRYAQQEFIPKYILPAMKQ